MAWTNMGTKANGVVIDQGDWNQMVNNFAYNGGATGDIKSGHWIPATTSTSNLGSAAAVWANCYSTNVIGIAGAHMVISANNQAGIGAGYYVLFGSPIAPSTDNTFTCGNGSSRWTAVFAVAGAINTSRREYKEAFVPVDPAHALDVVRRTPILSYAYKAMPDRRFSGFIADTADPLLSPDNDTVDAGTTAAVCLAALQALAVKVDALEASR